MNQSKRTIKAGILFLTTGLIYGDLNAEVSGTLPYHELEPYYVDAWGLASGEQRLSLLEEGRLLLGSGGGRSGTWLGEAFLETFAVTSMEALFVHLPGATRQARFGVATVPTMRGGAAETLFNGQRRGDNLFGLAPTLTAVESLEVIAGPTLLSAGLGKRSGGMVNITSRRPVTGQAFGSLELRLGTWVPGESSYRTLESRLDLNQPLGEGQALRLTAGWRDDATFYRRNGGRDDYRDLHLAWRGEGAGGSVLDLILYLHEGDRPQTLGVNRPWQGLVEDGLYPVGGVDEAVGKGDPPGPLDPGVADPGLLTGGAEDLVRLPRDRVLMSEGDYGRGEALLGQVIWSKPLGDALQFRQHLLVEQVRREKLNEFYYAEDVEQVTVDSISRLEGFAETGLGRLAWEAGLHARLEDRDNRTNYWNEFAYAFDLSTGRRFAALEEFSEFIAPGAVEGDDGLPWYLPSSGFSTPESTRSRVRQAALFGEVSQALGGGWSLDAGLRVDWLEVEAWEPKDLVPAGGWSDQETLPLVSGTLSVRKDWQAASAYLTWGHYRGISGNTVGDGVNLYAPGTLFRDDFLTRSRLLEVGGDWQLAEQLVLRGALFDQKRRRTEFFGSNDIEARGLEVEVDWRPLSGTRVRVTGNYLEVRYDEAAPAEFGGGSLWNVYAPGAGPTGEGNGLGYIGGFFLNSLSPDDYRVPGIPRWQIQGSLAQAFGEDLRVAFWGGWGGSVKGNLAGEYHIPEQGEWNLSLDYELGAWTCQITVRNLFDDRNWIHNGDTFFDQMLVSRNLPRRLEGRLRYTF